MEALSDDDFEQVSDLDISDYESDQDSTDHETPSSTPPSNRKLRASERKTIACTYEGCPKTFNRRARLEEHLRSHTNSRIFKCNHPGCGKDFLRETHLKHHVKSAHTNIRDYKCTWEGCNKSFATGTRLRRHFQAHEGREKYRCRGYDGCNQTFRKHETLKRHISQVHEQMKPFSCDSVDVKTGRQCDQAFDTAEKLRTHQRSKHDSTRFTCTECLSLAAQMSNSVSALTNQQANAYFATYSDLQAHIAEVHPPTCPHCSASFTTSKELTRHLELQHGIIDSNKTVTETYPCSFPNCDRVFSKKGNLTVHMKTVHEKKKDFICGETEIALPEELRSHGPIELQGCGRAFTSKATLEDHVRSAHLGMVSLQVTRRNKRKAERRGTDANEAEPEPKARKPRKDKGVKKTSILESLTGSAVQPDAMSFALDPALANPYAELQSRTFHDFTTDSPQVKFESDHDDDEWNQLSGSMVLLGDRLYHNGEQYEFTGNQHSSGLTPPPTDSKMSLESDLNSSYSKIKANATMHLDDEPFFGDFEHEPESMSGTLHHAISVHRAHF